MSASSTTTSSTGARGGDPPADDVLSAEERQALLAHARSAIAAAVRGEPLPEFRSPTPALMAAGRVFVSLHRRGALRGCVGTLAGDRPLHAAVAEMARAAALDDPRFPPVRPEELPELVIEISVLSTPRVTPPEQVDPGRHGLCIVHPLGRGVLLPQVATRYGWDRETFLARVSEKAGLPDDAWRDPAAYLLAFTAQVFSEAAP